MLFSWEDMLFEKPHSQTHTVSFVLIISVYPSWRVWCPFTRRLKGEKLLTWTLVPWISCQWQESADAANCLRKKSQQRSEIKCRQLLLCFLELHPGFNISYLLPDPLYLFIDDSDVSRTGFKESRRNSVIRCPFMNCDFTSGHLFFSLEL